MAYHSSAWLDWQHYHRVAINCRRCHGFMLTTRLDFILENCFNPERGSWKWVERSWVEINMRQEILCCTGDMTTAHVLIVAKIFLWNEWCVSVVVSKTHILSLSCYDHLAKSSLVGLRPIRAYRVVHRWIVKESDPTMVSVPALGWKSRGFENSACDGIECVSRTTKWTQVYFCSSAWHHLPRPFSKVSTASRPCISTF